MSEKHLVKTCIPRNTTWCNLQEEYLIFKQFIAANPNFISHIQANNESKYTREERTKSKSRRKRNTNKSPSRRSGRINNMTNEEEFLEIEKEPLWHQRRKKKEAFIERKPTHIETKPCQEMPKVRSFDPLYEFYSDDLPHFDFPHQESYLEAVIENTDKKMSKCSFNSSSTAEVKKTKLAEKEDDRGEELIEDKNEEILNELIDSDLDERELEDWSPSKLEGSLLAIQKLIDDYFIFNSNMRNRRLARVHDIVKYVREINGYFFSLDTLHQLLSINPKLYKIISMEREKYVKCPVLDSASVERRSLSTKIKMKLNKK